MTLRSMNSPRAPSTAALVVFLVCFAAGPASAIDPATTGSGEAGIRELSARIASLDERLQNTRQAMVWLQERTASLPTVTDTEPGATAGRLAAARALIEQQRKVLEELIASDSQLPKSLSLADLERRQRESEAERDALAKKLDNFDDSEGDQGPGLQATTVVSGKEPSILVLTKGRMVPFGEPYYSSRQVPCTNRTTREQLLCVQITRVRDGTAVAIGIQEGELLDELIEKDRLSPSSHVFFLLVSSDSVTSFHKLRQAIKKRGFMFGWRTFRDRTLLLPQNAGGGGDGKMQVF